MKYLKWMVMAVIDVLFNIVAYVTDPIILLFADEVGNLPGWALWWANWDDHLDIDWMVDEGHVPGFACWVLVQPVNRSDIRTSSSVNKRLVLLWRFFEFIGFIMVLVPY